MACRFFRTRFEWFRNFQRRFYLFKLNYTFFFVFHRKSKEYFVLLEQVITDDVINGKYAYLHLFIGLAS